MTEGGLEHWVCRHDQRLGEADYFWGRQGPQLNHCLQKLVQAAPWCAGYGLRQSQGEFKPVGGGQVSKKGLGTREM